MEKYINILKNTPLFQGISEAEILPMLKCLSVSIKNYSKGEYLLRSGDKVQTIGMILSGQALIINDDVWGNRNIITELSSGMLYGESYACISSVPAQISVIANENLTVMLFNINHIVTTCSSSCSFHTRLIHNLLEIIARKNVIFNSFPAYSGIKKNMCVLRTKVDAVSTASTGNRHHSHNYLSSQRSSITSPSLSGDE